MRSPTISKFIEDFTLLPLNDKQYVIDIIKKQLMEAKREAIAQRAKDVLENVKKGEVKKGTIIDLRKDLEND